MADLDSVVVLALELLLPVLVPEGPLALLFSILVFAFGLLPAVPVPFQAGAVLDRRPARARLFAPLRSAAGRRDIHELAARRAFAAVFELAFASEQQSRGAKANQALQRDDPEAVHVAASSVDAFSVCAIVGDDPQMID